MNGTPIGTTEHPYVLRINRRNKQVHWADLSTGLNEIVVETGAKYVSVRHTFDGKPYLSLHGGEDEKTTPEKWKNLYPIPDKTNKFRILGKAFIKLLIEDEPAMDDIKLIDLVLVPMESTDSDSLMDLEFREWIEVEDSKSGGHVHIDENSFPSIDSTKVTEDTPMGTNNTTAETEPVSEEEPDTPGSDIWMRVLYCDNGYVVRDDAGVMMVIHSEGSSNKKIARHLGEEIMCEIDDMEEHLETEKPVYGWEVNVNIQPITTPDGFFKEGGGR